MTVISNALITSIVHAITHLTNPLRSVYDEAKCSKITAELTSAFFSAFSEASLGAVITVKAQRGDPGPPLLDAICLSSGITWTEWFNLLGGEAFDLLVSEHDVLAIDFNGFKRPIGPQPSCYSATTSAPRKRTLAQQLLEQESERIETDRLFALLSSAIISPTPTRDNFPASVYNDYATPFATANDGLSRSSVDHRASHSSSLLSISFGSDIETETEPSSLFSSRPSSRSSASSMPHDKQAIVVAPSSKITIPIHRATRSLPHYLAAYQQFPPKTSAFSAQSRAPSPLQPLSPRVRGLHHKAHSTIPVTPSQYDVDDNGDYQPPVFVDQSKNDRTKYLYEGGISTVLTGGVMLGCPAATKLNHKNDRSKAIYRTVVTVP